MPYDKLIDSKQLDGALSATADAIRAKSGGSSKITWDATKGFAEAIAASSSVKTGTFTATYGNPSTVRIRGLGFKPSTIILFAIVDDVEDVGVNSLEENCLYAIFNGNNTTSFYGRSFGTEEEREDENGDPYIYYSSEMCMYNISTALNIVSDNDGFVITSPRYNYGYLNTDGIAYRYYAF